MKQIILALISCFFVAFSIGCAPSASQLEAAIKENPQVVWAAIEADPVGFFKVVRQAEGAARAEEGRNQEKAFKEQMDEEFKNPKKPVVEEDRVIFGESSAAITIVEFSDFQCGHCANAHKTMKRVKEKYGDKVRLVFKHLPFQRPYGRPAAEYFEAIAMQSHSKAQKYHDYIFDNQSQLRSGGIDFIQKAAKHAGASLSRIKKDLESDKIKARIETDMEEARKFEFGGTPGFIVNGVTLKGAYPYEIFVEVIDRHLGEDS